MSGRRRSRAGVLGSQRITRDRGGPPPTASADRLAAIIAGAIVLVVLAAVGIVVVSMGSKAYRYVVNDDRLFVETISVEGNVILTKDEITALSGVKLNASMLSLDLPSIAARIKKNPRVADAVVERHLPRRVLISVTERIPIGLVQDGGTLKGIDASGTIIPLIPAREEVKGPIITGRDKRDMPADMLPEALSAIELMRPDVIAKISEVRLDPVGGITLLTTGTPVVIRLGRGAMPAKIERLRTALKLFEERGETKEYIDVRFADIVTRP